MIGASYVEIIFKKSDQNLCGLCVNNGLIYDQQYSNIISTYRLRHQQHHKTHISITSANKFPPTVKHFILVSRYNNFNI